MKNPLKLIVALCLAVGFAAHAEITSLINYQGKLKRHGTNVNEQVSAVFRIFTGQTNEVCVYEETNQVAVVDGLYSTLIGGNPSLGAIEEATKLDDAYLEVEINGKKLKPREKFTPPPFARKSEKIWTVHAVSIGEGYPIAEASEVLALANSGGWAGHLGLWKLYPEVDDYNAVFPPSETRHRITAIRMMRPSVLDDGLYYTNAYIRVIVRDLAGTQRLPVLATNQYVRDIAFDEWTSPALNSAPSNTLLNPTDMVVFEYHKNATNAPFGVNVDAELFIQVEVR